jgi:hypothetical protein
MACKYDAPGFIEDERRDPILEHIDLNPGNKRDIQYVLKTLEKSKVLRLTADNKIYIYNGSYFGPGSDSYGSIIQERERNLNVIQAINSLVGDVFKLKATPAWSYKSPLNYRTETYEVTIDRNLFESTPAGFTEDAKLPAFEVNNITGQTRLPFDQRMVRNNESAKLEELASISERFATAFKAAGVNVEIVFNADLDVYGRVVPISPTEARIELNPQIATLETAYHEPAHIFIDLVGLNNPDVQGALNELRGSELDALVREKYPELAGERYDKELLATYLGLGGLEYKAQPNALQKFVNNIIDFFARILGLDTRSGERLLERFMRLEYSNLENGVIDEAVQEMRATRRRKPKDSSAETTTKRGRRATIRQQFAERDPQVFAQDLMDKIADRIVVLERKGGVINNRTRALRSEEIQLLESLKSQLALLEDANEFSSFVLTAQRRVRVMNARMTALINEWPELGDELLSQERYEANIGRLVSIMDEINFYYNSDFTKSTLHIISRLVDTQIDKYEKTQKEGARSNPIYKELVKMQERLTEIVPALEKLNEEVYYVGLDYHADWLLGFHDANLDPKVKAIIDQLQETKRWRGGLMPLGLRTSDPRVNEIKKRYNNKEINKDEYNDEIRELAIEHIKEKLPNRESLRQMLRVAYKDKSSYSFWVDPHIYSSWVPAQLFQKGVQTHLTFGTEKTRAEVFKLSLARQAFQEGTGRTDFNPAKFNEELIEKVTYWVVDPATDKSVKMELMSFVQPFLVEKFNNSKKEFFEGIKKKYNPPKYDPSSPEEFIEWRNSEDGKNYYKAIQQWWNVNTDRTDNAIETLDKIAEEYMTLIKDVARMQGQARSGKAKGKILTEASIEKLEQDVQAKLFILEQLEKDVKDMVVVNESSDRFLQNYSQGKYKKDLVIFQKQYAKPKESLYANPKYQTIQNSTVLKSAYDSLIGVMQEKQKLLGFKTPMRKNAWEDFSYLVPSVRENTKNRLIEQGVYKTLKDSIQDGTQAQATDTNYGVLLDTNGDPLKSTAMYFVNAVPANDVSKDIWESVALFAHMANMHKALGKVTDVATMQLTLMGNMSVGKQNAGNPIVNFRKGLRGELEQVPMQGRDSFMYKATKEFIDGVIYGQRDIRMQFQAFGKTLDGGKIASNIAKYTALNTLSLNLLQATNQFLLDNFQSFNEALAKEYYSPKDLSWAKSVYWGAAGAIADLNTFTQKTKLGQAMVMFDALVENTDGPHARGGNAAKKVIDTNNLMFVQKGVEHELQAVRMLALMRNTKGFKTKTGDTIFVEKGSRKLTTIDTGEEANLWDVLTKNDKGYLRVDRMVGNYTNKDVAAFTLKLRGISRMTNQIKGSMDRSRYQRRWWGKLVGLFRNWMPPGIRRRFGHADGVHIDEELGNATEGMYVSFARWMTDIFTTQGALANLPESWNSRTDMEKANIKRTGMELGFGVMLMALSTLLMSMVDDDEEETPLHSFMLYQTMRLKSEMFQYMSLGDAYRMIKSPTPTARPIGNILDLISHLFLREIPYAVGLPVDEKNIFYQRNSGMFDKGDRKIAKKFYQSFPVGPGLMKSFNAKEAVEFFEQSPFK